MFQFWELAIRPVLDAMSPQAVVEIGSLRGQTTRLLLDHLGADARLDVIDPLPQFDPTELGTSFGARYRFHRDTSLRVLPGLDSVDVALIDGDHNWYTVYHELQLLSAAAGAAGSPLPVLIMHDVGWPYGRRDLYYDPSQIPEEFRQAYARRGIRRGRSELLANGGINAQLHNASHEGGPRNGVATALDDFLGEYAAPVRTVVLPVYFGLAIVADEWRLAREPQLASHLDWLESAEGQHQLLELSEELYAGAVTSQHNATFGSRDRLDRSIDQYLELLAAALLDEHYLDHELRIDYLLNCLRKGRELDPRVLRDPERLMADDAARLRSLRQTGRLQRDGSERRPYFPYTTMGRRRLSHLRECLDDIRRQNVSGDLIACGTGRGGGGIYLRGYLSAHELPTKLVWLADTFDCSPPQGRVLQPVSADLNAVRDGFAQFGLLDERVRLLRGPVTETLKNAPLESVALLHLGDALEAPVFDVLDRIYDKVSVGGWVIVEGDAESTAEAVHAFRTHRSISEGVERIDAGSVCWRKLSPTAKLPGAATDRKKSVAAFAAPRSGSSELSVVVIVFNMRREATRTLHSLSRAYQRDVDDLDYEIIVIDNGSDADQSLGEECVRAFGPEFRYLSLGAAATPSPARAANYGLAAARGTALAFMIDGAHVLTPGVLRYGMAGLRLYQPAVVATQQWYVGPGQQREAMAAGFDMHAQDRLFDEIGWPSRGYDLFNVGHFIGERDWFDPFSESNCLFVSRDAVEQAGAFDESFTSPGGGLTNLDLFEKVASAPDVRLVSILGEASFHQMHGGTTTNVISSPERRARMDRYHAEYARLRGKPFRRLVKPIHYVGRFSSGALRTRARRRMAPTLWRAGQEHDRDGLPAAPGQVPDDLTLEYTMAYWRSRGWQEVRWLKARMGITPADLVAYQELIARLQPDWVIETRPEGGQLATFLASVCDLVGGGQILSVGPGDSVLHSRVSGVTGEPSDPDVVRAVYASIGEARQALLILGSQVSAVRTVAQFAAYSPLVQPGGYVIVEDTILGGHPVWPSYGPGPAEAVSMILQKEPTFSADRSLERLGPSFNPRGYLRRDSR